MNLVDIHIIIYQEPQWKINRCLESLRAEPVNIHIVSGKQEMPPFNGRRFGFSIGTAPYVGYVDPDDTIVPGCFQKLLKAISSGNYDAAYGWESAIHKGVFLEEHKEPHHGFILKRNLQIDYGQEFRVFNTLPEETVVCVPEVLYHWRRD